MNDKIYSTVTERGQVSIPASIRQILGIQPGNRISWEVKDGGILNIKILPPIEQPVGPLKTLGYLARIIHIEKPLYEKQLRSDDVLSELREGEE